MRNAILVAVLFVLAGCAGTNAYVPPPSACTAGEATPECQHERYLKAY
ncbi:MAG: hypothetical protein ACAH21_11515 [Ramlibacter sp.]|nr:hypothetical protein [Ramlibacter sp.]